MSDLIIGRINAPHGVKGFLKISSYSGETSHFRNLTDVVLEKDGKTRTIRVSQVKEDGNAVLIKFVGIETPEEARVLMGYEIKVPREKAASLEKDEYYIGDLVNCSVLFENREVGKINAVCDGSKYNFLEITLPNSEKRLVPFMNEYVGAVDIEKKTIELKNEWILE